MIKYLALQIFLTSYQQVWFEAGIEGNDPVDQEEEDWGETIEFGFRDNLRTIAHCHTHVQAGKWKFLHMSGIL